jgi:hypothetical protein
MLVGDLLEDLLAVHRNRFRGIDAGANWVALDPKTNRPPRDSIMTASLLAS